MITGSCPRAATAVIAIALGSSLLVGVPDAVVAQPGQCGYCALAPCLDGTHAVWGGWKALGGRHVACWAPGNCVAHWMGCNPTDDEQQEVDAIVEAALRGKLETLRKLLPEAPERVYVNTSRNVLQLLSCDGDIVVAQYPLPERALSAGS